MNVAAGVMNVAAGVMNVAAGVMNVAAEFPRPVPGPIIEHVDPIQNGRHFEPHLVSFKGQDWNLLFSSNFSYVKCVNVK